MGRCRLSTNTKTINTRAGAIVLLIFDRRGYITRTRSNDHPSQKNAAEANFLRRFRIHTLPRNSTHHLAHSPPRSPPNVPHTHFATAARHKHTEPVSLFTTYLASSLQLPPHRPGFPPTPQCEQISARDGYRDGTTKAKNWRLFKGTSSRSWRNTLKHTDLTKTLYRLGEEFWLLEVGEQEHEKRCRD